MRVHIAALFVMLSLFVNPLTAQDAAAEAWNSGDVETAQRLYEARLEKNSADTQALHRLALIHFWAGRNEPALEYFDRLSTITPGDDEAALDRARVLAVVRGPAAAAASLEPFLDSGSANLELLRLYAQWTSWTEQFHTAVSAYDRILEITPEDNAAALQRARVLSWASEFERSIAAYRSILDRTPNDPDSLLGLGQVLSWAGEYEQAELTFRRVLETVPEHKDALTGLARVSAWSGRLREAEDRWRKVLAIDPSDSVALTGLAATLRWQGRNAAALEEAMKASEIAPADPETMAQLKLAKANLRPAFSPSYSMESDSDDNSIGTTAAGASFFLSPRLQGSVDIYQRDAEDTSGQSLTLQSRGAKVNFEAFLEPGWKISAGGGATELIDASSSIPSYRFAISSPRRHPFAATISYGSSAYDATARLMEREVELAELSLAASLTPSTAWNLTGGAALGTFTGLSGLENDRTRGDLTITRRFGANFRAGLAARVFTFEHDLDEGYFDPDLYWNGEVLLRYSRPVGNWRIDLDLAPGVQQVGEDGSQDGTLRGAATLGYEFSPGRFLSLSGGYSNSGIQRLSETSDGSYTYRGASISARWAF